MAWKPDVIEIVLLHCGTDNEGMPVFKFYEQGALGWYDYGMITLDGLPFYIDQLRKDAFIPCIHLSYHWRDLGFDYPIQDAVWSLGYESL